MAKAKGHKQTLTPEMVVQAYLQGYFPMADARDSRGVKWYLPAERAVLPLESFHIPHGLRRRMRQDPYEITLDQAFPQVMAGCAQPREDDPETWINADIQRVYGELHQAGLAHSVEAWMVDPASHTPDTGPAGARRLVGGLYGVALGGAFFGESMFSREADASKLCLVRLVEHLCARGYQLLDAQLPNPHLEQFGMRLLKQEEYLARLHEAVVLPVRWDGEDQEAIRAGREPGRP